MQSMPPGVLRLSPYTSASPPLGGSTPVRQLMVVVLPAPLGPSRQNNLSCSMLNQEPLMAQNSPPAPGRLLFLTQQKLQGRRVCGGMEGMGTTGRHEGGWVGDHRQAGGQAGWQAGEQLR
jgi:hypothetical protein